MSCGLCDCSVPAWTSSGATILNTSIQTLQCVRTGSAPPSETATNTPGLTPAKTPTQKLPAESMLVCLQNKGGVCMFLNNWKKTHKNKLPCCNNEALVGPWQTDTLEGTSYRRLRVLNGILILYSQELQPQARRVALARSLHSQRVCAIHYCVHLESGQVCCGLNV